MQKNRRTNKKYSPEFKLSVMLNMREHHLGYSETMRKYFPLLQSKNFGFLQKWERIYLEEGAVGLTIERHGLRYVMRKYIYLP